MWAWLKYQVYPLILTIEAVPSCRRCKLAWIAYLSSASSTLQFSRRSTVTILPVLLLNADLLSSTQYTITVGTGSSAVSGSYRTLPRPASYLSPAGSSAGVNTGGAVLTSFKMAHSSCAHDKGNDLAEIAQSGSDMLLLLGDQMYTDLAKNDSASFQADLRHPKVWRVSANGSRSTTVRSPPTCADALTIC